MRIFVYEYTCAQPDLSPALHAEGRAMLDAVVADLSAIPDVTPVLLLDQTNATAEESRFRQLAATCDFTLVIAPEFDEILSTRCRWIEEAGGRSLGCSLAAIQLTADKLHLAQHLREHDVPTPVTHRAANFQGGFPAVSKPRFGAGSQSMRLLHDAAALTSLPPDFIVQEYVAGTAASVAFLIGAHECVPLPPAYQQLALDGTFRYLGGAIPLPEELGQRAIDLGRRAVQCVAGLRGYVGVDLVLADDSLKDAVIEINPRLTTSYIGLRRLAVSNLAAALLRVGTGERIGQLSFREDTIHW